ncbi:MAG: lysophospholipid acyltransferase family protein [Acidobacteria bacterium]|nr:lysophospholipid acyltransferase family protein [Acidobacteriota bacterium]
MRVPYPRPAQGLRRLSGAHPLAARLFSPYPDPESAYGFETAAVMGNSLHKETFQAEGGQWRRLYFSAVGWLGWLLIQLLARTWRWETHGYEHFSRLEEQGLPVIFAFWHGRIMPATFFWRNRGIVVLTSRNRDGEYIAHIIRRFGYGSSRGSTSRGAVEGTRSLLRTLRKGGHVAFTVDGPRGPRHRVQQGVAWLASYSQRPILPFHIEARRARVLSSWDRFQIPLPFSRVRVDIAEPMFLEKEMSEEALDQKRLELQNALNQLCRTAEGWARADST